MDGGDAGGGGGGAPAPAHRPLLPGSQLPGGPILPPTARVLMSPEGIRVVLLGSTHVSFSSVEEAQRVVASLTPRVVFLELCRNRKHLLYQPLRREPVRELTAAALVEELRANGTTGIINTVLHNFMASMGDQLGIDFTPGAEFIAAFQEASKYFPREQQPAEGHGMVQLGDRDVNVTLQRAVRALTVWDKVKLAWGFLTSSLDDITAEDLEAMRDSDVITELFLELGREQPRLLEPLLHERDRYMRYRLRHSCSKLALFLSTPQGRAAHEAWGEGSSTLVAVVGMGHVKGIADRWDEPVDEDDMRRISEIPPEPLGDRVAKWAFAAVGVAAVVGAGYLVFRGVRCAVLPAAAPSPGSR